MERIGFIGTGLMGNPMAKNLLNAGYQLTVSDISKENANNLLSAGAAWADSPKDVAKASDVVITMVPNSAVSQAVSCGANGILEGANENMTLIDMSSIDPSMSRYIAERAKEKHIPMLDAPVTGNPEVAKAAKLGIMVGGSKTTFEACLPIFEKIGKKIVYVGENGKGATLKLVNNLILGIAIEAVAEAFVLAIKAGIDPERVIEITSVGGARTGAMETRGPQMVRRDFSPGFSTNNMYKDLTSAMKLADECGASIPAASASLEILRAAKTMGRGDLDSCSVMAVLGEMANIKM